MMTRLKDTDLSLPASAEQYPVPCPKCGADANVRGVSTVVGDASLLHLKVVCGGCQHSWTVAKPTLPLGIGSRRAAEHLA